MEALIGSNAKYQALLTDAERKLAQAAGAADEARDTVRERWWARPHRVPAHLRVCQLIPLLLPDAPALPALAQARREGMRAEALEAEKKLLATAEARAAAEAAEASRERFRLAAELEAARKVHADREAELVRERERLKDETQRAQRELADAQRELGTARSRAESAVKSGEGAAAEAGAKLGKLEEEVGGCWWWGGGGWSRSCLEGVVQHTASAATRCSVGPTHSHPLPPPSPPTPVPQVRQLRDSLSNAQQRATAAEARVELLQDAVRKAEERAARLEMAAASRAAAGDGTSGVGAGAGAGAADGSREAELAAEVKLLREELSAAQVGPVAGAVLDRAVAVWLCCSWQQFACLVLTPSLTPLLPPRPSFAAPPAGGRRCRHRPLQAV